MVRLLRQQPHTVRPAPRRKEAYPHGGRYSPAAVNVAGGAIAVFFENHGEMTINVKSGDGQSEE